MGVSSEPKGVWRFGIFEADLDAGELRKNGARIHLQDQPFQVLTVLLLRAGQLVTREELRHEVWPENTFVEFDHALNTAVKKIRIAIGDDANSPRYIETIPKRGYRFIAPGVAPTDVVNTSAGVVVSPNESPRKGDLSRRGVAMAVAACVAILVLTGVVSFYRMRSEAAAARGRVVVAVIPFESSSEDVGQASFCDGITQELITQLGRTDPGKLGLAARASVLPYWHSSKSVQQIGYELQADYVMEGSLRRDGPHLRVSAELIRVRDQARIWGDDFDEQQNGDLLRVETELAKAIAIKVRSSLLDATRP
jgi:TolB-like protein/DNA-binding winged helix-turn-helix (wHTH) protein